MTSFYHNNISKTKGKLFTKPNKDKPAKQRISNEKASLSRYASVACTIKRISGLPVMQVIMVMRLRSSSYRIR